MLVKRALFHNITECQEFINYHIIHIIQSHTTDPVPVGWREEEVSFPFPQIALAQGQVHQPFLHCVFSNVSSELLQSHIGCISLFHRSLSPRDRWTSSELTIIIFIFSLMPINNKFWTSFEYSCDNLLNVICNLDYHRDLVWTSYSKVFFDIWLLTGTAW